MCTLKFEWLCVLLPLFCFSNRLGNKHNSMFISDGCSSMLKCSYFLPYSEEVYCPFKTCHWLSHVRNLHRCILLWVFLTGDCIRLQLLESGISPFLTLFIQATFGILWSVLGPISEQGCGAVGEGLEKVYENDPSIIGFNIWGAFEGSGPLLAGV